MDIDSFGMPRDKHDSPAQRKENQERASSEDGMRNPNGIEA